jgi:branched-chain amino acid transport system permease protein
MRWRAHLAFPLAIALLATLSLYRVTLGFSLAHLAILTSVLFWTAQATSWNILSGYSGYFSFGQAAYVGVGAYTTAVLYGRHDVSFYLTVPIAAALCAVLAAAVGAMAFRLRSLRGEIFALLTLAVPFILAALARINSTIDGGQGIVLSPPSFPEGLGENQDFLYLAFLLLAGLAVWLAYAIQHSRFGWALSSIRDAEDVAEGLGVATFRYKMLAIVASGVIGGVGGSLFALQLGFIQVESVFNLTIPLYVIVMSVLGGRSHWLGPVIGAGLIVLLQDRLSASGLDSWQLIVLGGALAVLVVIAPEGLYARLRGQPVLAAGGFVVVTGALWIADVWGEPQDWILFGMLAAAAAALWPGGQRFLRRRPAATEPAPPPPAAAEAESVFADAQTAKGELLVECSHVAKYFGGVRALEDVTVQVREGELIGLVGPNGSGKTTLVSLLAGTLRPTRGSVRVVGQDIARLSPHRVAHVGIARTYQIPRPFASMTVRDNVAMAVMFGRVPRPLDQARELASTHIAFVGLSHLADALPTALNLHQRQLLEIARALATSPKVLLLDEALAGLNPVEIDNAVEVVRRIQQSGTAVIIVEHLLRVVNQLATRVVVLDRGSCLADGDPKSVMSDPAVIRAYLGKRAHA